jgi:hypothetical protein
MKNDSPASGSFSGLAKRWLKTQLRLDGDPIKAHHAKQEAEALEQEARERAEYETGRAIFNAVLPSKWKDKLDSLEALSRKAQDDRFAAERARIEGLPHARVEFSLSGDLNGRFDGLLPVEVIWPDDEGDWVVVSIEPIEPIEFGAHEFFGLRFALPVSDVRHAQPVELASAVERYEASWDPLDAQIWIDSDESSFFWTTDGESPRFWPGAELETLAFVFPARDESGQHVKFEGRIALSNEVKA